MMSCRCLADIRTHGTLLKPHSKIAVHYLCRCRMLLPKVNSFEQQLHSCTYCGVISMNRHPVCRSLWRTRSDPAGSVRQLARELRRPQAHSWFCRHQRRRPPRETRRRHVRVPIQGHRWISYRSVESKVQTHSRVHKSKVLLDINRENKITFKSF